MTRIATAFKIVTTNQAAPLHGFLRRSPRSPRRSVVSPHTNLPALEDFIGASDELLEKLTEWHNLQEQARLHSREARKAQDAATFAEQAHRDAVRAAMTAGEDVSKVKNNGAVERHRNAAQVHQKHAEAAQNARFGLGFELAPMLETESPAIASVVDLRVERSAARIAVLLDQMTAAFSEWNRAFDLRTWLSHTIYDGGPVTAYDPANRMPAAVTEALETLAHYASSLDRLREDEAQVVAFRERLS